MRSFLAKRIYETPRGHLAAEIQIDGKRTVVLMPGMEYIDPGLEIMEEGVTQIELAASSTFNRAYHPGGGKVKFFRDELGQTWVKFRCYSDGHEFDYVAPAERVVLVQYLKREGERTPS